MEHSGWKIEISIFKLNIFVQPSQAFKYGGHLRSTVIISATACGRVTSVVVRVLENNVAHLNENDPDQQWGQLETDVLPTQVRTIDAQFSETPQS